MGFAQLESLNSHVAIKRRMGARYSELLKGIPDLQLPQAKAPYADNIYWVYGLVLGSAYSFDAFEIMKRLSERKIGTRPFFWPMHEQPVFRKMGLFAETRCPVAESLARRGFYIPSGLGLHDVQIEQVVETLKDVLQ